MGKRLLAATLVALFAATALAGCFASGNEVKVLNTYERETPDGDERIRFSVKDGVDEVTVFVSTKSKGSNFPTGCYDWMTGSNQCPEENTAGRIRIEIRYPDDSLYDSRSIGYEATETITIPEPRTGTWSTVLFYRNGYDGPTNVRITAPDDAQVLLGGSFWDVLGVMLALMTIIGGAFLYRRRTTFMNREIVRIDQTYTNLADDIDECRTNLLDLRESLHQLLLRGKIQEGQYLILERRIEQYLQDLDTPGNRHRARNPRPAPISLGTPAPAAGDASGAWEAVPREPTIDDTNSWIDLDDDEDLDTDSALRKLRERQRVN